MIILTKLSGQEILINENHIEMAQETPDTVITMNNGHSYIVTEKLDEIVDKAIEFNKQSKRRPERRELKTLGAQD
ncbi:MAG: flagellar FlbD family protein [Oscillospiraceae bacterium]|nr:flagellar FlbD family protein [Oscillospiraceae bacterium]